MFSDKPPSPIEGPIHAIYMVIYHTKQVDKHLLGRHKFIIITLNYLESGIHQFLYTNILLWHHCFNYNAQVNVMHHGGEYGQSWGFWGKSFLHHWDSDMALLTLWNSDRMCNRSRRESWGTWGFRHPNMPHGGDSDTIFFCARIPTVCPSSPSWGVTLTSA